MYKPQVVWKGDDIWLEVELQHFSLKGLAEKWDLFKTYVSRRGSSAATPATATPSSTTTSSAHSQAGAQVSRTPLGSNEYPETQVFNDTEVFQPRAASLNLFHCICFMLFLCQRAAVFA